jgi:3'-phosphoadenosine 5'-phosphosulfate sulfotransferase (PAPS reductase)/FAD synthetase
MPPKYIIFSSMGNDSIALIRWAHVKGIKPHVGYSNTGWAAKWWPDRVDECENWLKQMGMGFTEIPSEGFKEMVRRKKGFPRQGYQYCTGELKIVPAMAWLDIIDPEKKSIILVGLRRAESENRKDHPSRNRSSSTHGGRKCIYPLINHSHAERDQLVIDAGFKVLPHRSMECFPCINSNRVDILQLAKDPERIAEIEAFEEEMGFTRKGKPRTMFRPYRHMGATGIREIVKWAMSPKGKYRKGQEVFDLDDGTDEPNPGCIGGWCGI